MRLLLVVVLAAGGLGLVPPPANAACAAPYQLEAPGSGSIPLDRPLEVTGTLFFERVVSNDTPDEGGCSRREEGDSSPARGVVLRLTQGDRTFDLGEADAQADPLASIRWEAASLPAQLVPGPAVLTTSKSSVGLPVRLVP